MKDPMTHTNDKKSPTIMKGKIKIHLEPFFIRKKKTI